MGWSMQCQNGNFAVGIWRRHRFGTIVISVGITADEAVRDRLRFPPLRLGSQRLLFFDGHRCSIKRIVIAILDPAKAAAGADISVIVIEHAVTIQECGGPLPFLLFSRRSCENLRTGRVPRPTYKMASFRIIPVRHRGGTAALRRVRI